MTTMNIFDMADTWNAGGTTFTAIKMNVTDTASAAGSLLLDLQVGGSSRFSVTKAGRVAAGVGYVYANPQFYDLTVGTNVGVGISASDVTTYINGQANFSVGAANSVTGARLAGDVPLGWVNGHAISNAPDLQLHRDAADTLAQRRGTNAQSFRVYRTFTDSSNYERLHITGVGSNFDIETQNAGTGLGRNLRIVTTTAHPVQFGTANTMRWEVNSAGHFQAAADNTYDIGAGGANRPRDIYAAGVIYAVVAEMASSGYFGYASRTRIRAPSDGVLSLRNAAETDFSRLQFGGTTASFPALKRNATALETKLADDSAYAPHAMQYLDINDGMTAPAAATGRARIYVDTADGDLKVVFADGTVKTIVTDT